MDFRQNLSTEASTLINELLAQHAQTPLLEAETLRYTMERAVQAMNTALGVWSSADGDTDLIASVVERLSALAAKEVERASAEAGAQHEELQQQIAEHVSRHEQLVDKLADASAEADALRGELQAQIQAGDALRVELAHARERLAEEEAAHRRAQADWQENAGATATLEPALREAQMERDAIASRLVAAVARIEALESVTVDQQHAQRELEAIRDDLVAAHARLEEQAAQTERDAAQWRAEAQSAEQVAREATEALEAATTQAETRRLEEASALQGSMREAVVLLLDRLLAADRRFAKGKTALQVLAALAESLAEDFPRVALIQVNGDTLDTVQQVGFDSEWRMAPAGVSANFDSLLADTIKSGKTRAVMARELADGSGILFGGTPNFVLAIPVTVGGQVLAVVYADDSGQPQHLFTTPVQQVKFAHLLLRQATARLRKVLALEQYQSTQQAGDDAALLSDEAAHLEKSAS